MHAPEIIVPAGTFQMGSRDGEGGDQEWPQHKVTIAGPFAVGRFAVTFDEWESIIPVTRGGAGGGGQ
jgi:formylglycine-generating enzyme required for sulfatase activity